MPQIDVTAVAGTFSNKRELTHALTAALMRWEQVPSIPWSIDNTAAVRINILTQSECSIDSSLTAAPMSRGCGLRAPVRPVDLNRYALRVGLRVDQV
jgi:hypothetical protein